MSKKPNEPIPNGLAFLIGVCTGISLVLLSMLPFLFE